ncbi:MAG: type III pantothenate kinase [Solirubrobacterales bacterium]|nr:type III pantothenate kinase [Solirubrobacterales bacterium]
MLLAIDVGNTQTHVGAFVGENLTRHWRFQTRAGATGDELAERLAGLLALRGLGFGDLDGVVVSSVVPPLGTEYGRLAQEYLDVECLVVGPGVRTGMKVEIDNPAEVGADRLVNAIAAYEQVQDVCVCVDFGTGINFDAVSAEGSYLGGAIAPGVEISLTALTERAARISRIDLAEPATTIGTSSKAAIQSGVLYGFAGLVDGIARRINAELGGKARFIATGGLAGEIVPHSEQITEIDDLLTLKGLRLIHERNRS